MPALLEFCANGFQDAEVVTATRAALTALEALTALPLNAETRRGARQETCEGRRNGRVVGQRAVGGSIGVAMGNRNLPLWIGGFATERHATLEGLPAADARGERTAEVTADISSGFNGAKTASTLVSGEPSPGLLAFRCYLARDLGLVSLLASDWSRPGELGRRPQSTVHDYVLTPSASR